MSNANVEGGLRAHRTEFAREDTYASAPSNPTFLKYSDAVNDFNWTSDSVNEPRFGLGDADPQGFLKGPETHEVTVAYDLVKWFEAIKDPSSSTTLGVKSTDSADTGIDVTLTNEDGTVSETITTDGTDATTFVAGTTSFSTLGKVELSAAAAGSIEVYTDSSGSAGTLLESVPAGTTLVENWEDAAYDGMVRDTDNLLPNSHTIMNREDKGSIQAAQTISGNTSRSTRVYTVGKGALIDEVTVTGDPSDSQPVNVELTYLAQKVRSYQIDQPASSTILAVDSSDTADDTQTLTIENEGAGTTEDVALNGTNAVGTSSSFADIDAAHLSAETEGNISIYVNTGSTTSPTLGDKLLEIKGKTGYGASGQGEGDLGVPALGTGSHETLSNPAAERTVGDTIDTGGSEIDWSISAMTLTISNNLEETERAAGFGMGVHAGNRELNMETTLFGEALSHDYFTKHLRTTSQNVTWNLDAGSVQLDNAVLLDPGERAYEEGQAIMTMDSSFQAEGITILTNN